MNIPPDRRGRIHEADGARLMELAKELDLTFNQDLALGARVIASSVRGNDKAYGAGNVTDGDDETYWATDDDVTTGELVLQLPERVSFNRVRVEEFIELGQRVEEFFVDAKVDGAWVEVGNGVTIGPRRVMRPQFTTCLRAVDVASQQIHQRSALQAGSNLLKQTAPVDGICRWCW